MLGPRVGVLGIQGDIEKHQWALGRVGAESRRVLHARDLEGLVGLVLPGGESTTISKGLVRHDLVQPIRDFAAAGHAVLGTCAGAILLSRVSRNHPVPTLGLIGVEAERNAYGTQVDSFVAPADEDSQPAWAGMRCVFIRAPRLTATEEDVEVLARVGGEPVLVREAQRWACTFHPELTEDLRLHRAFVEGIAGAGLAPWSEPLGVGSAIWGD